MRFEPIRYVLVFTINGRRIRFEHGEDVTEDRDWYSTMPEDLLWNATITEEMLALEPEEGSH